MSVEIYSGDTFLGQLASNNGYSALTKYCTSPALKELVETGKTTNVAQMRNEIKQLVGAKELPKDILATFAVLYWNSEGAGSVEIVL